jgi:hypothetical protein
MQARDHRDLVGGAVLVCAGAFVIAYATTQLQLGSLQRMGPGLFPAALGGLLCIFGAIIAVPAFFREGVAIPAEGRPIFFVLAAILAFGVAIRPLGVAPAVMIMTIVSTFAERRMSWWSALLLAAILAGLAVLVFNVGLDIPVEPIRWPFG